MRSAEARFAGKRKISAEQARKLARMFSVNAGLFI